MATENIKVTISGTLRENERWSVNPWFGVSFGTVTSDPDTFAAAAAAVAAVEIPTALKTAMTVASSMNSVRLEGRNSQGELEVVGEAFLSPGQLGMGTAGQANQTAMVLSLRTNRVGRSGRGRLYWPFLPTAGINATGRIQLPTPAAAATDAAAYLAEISAALGGVFEEATFFPAVWSPKLLNRVAIVSVRVGNVADTMRSRRNALPEVYAEAPIFAV